MQIVVVDDHPIFRDGLSQILRSLFVDAEIMYAGDYGQLQSAIKDNPQPDLITLDLVIPGFDWRTDMLKLRRSLTLTPIAIVSMVQNDEAITCAMDVGINGFVSKGVQPDLLADSILQIMEGETLVRRAGDILSSNDESNLLAKLTARQIDVLRLICKGMSNKEIARELDLSPFTVRIHVSALFKSLGVSSRTSAVAIATASGFS
ncbi:MAG: response regulator transcription factor [Pseudomonadota bacterium]